MENKFSFSRDHFQSLENLMCELSYFVADKATSARLVLESEGFEFITEYPDDIARSEVVSSVFDNYRDYFKFELDNGFSINVEYFVKRDKLHIKVEGYYNYDKLVKMVQIGFGKSPIEIVVGDTLKEFYENMDDFLRAFTINERSYVSQYKTELNSMTFGRLFVTVNVHGKDYFQISETISNALKKLPNFKVDNNKYSFGNGIYFEFTAILNKDWNKLLFVFNYNNFHIEKVQELFENYYVEYSDNILSDYGVCCIDTESMLEIER